MPLAFRAVIMKHVPFMFGAWRTPMLSYQPSKAVSLHEAES